MKNSNADFTFQWAAQTEVWEKAARMCLAVCFFPRRDSCCCCCSALLASGSSFFFFYVDSTHAAPLLFPFSHSRGIWNWARKEESSTLEPHSRLTIRPSVSRCSLAPSSFSFWSWDAVSVFRRNRQHPTGQPCLVVRILGGLHCLSVK